MQRGRLGALSWGEQQTWAVAADLEMRENGGWRAAGAWHAFLGERCLWRRFTGTSQSGVFSIPLHPALDSEFPKEVNALAISLEVLTVKARAATGGCPASLVQRELSVLFEGLHYVPMVPAPHLTWALRLHTTHYPGQLLSFVMAASLYPWPRVSGPSQELSAH